MADKETLVGLALFTGQNLSANLQHIPADKLDWKPAPDANSALEIVNHIAMVFHGFNARFGGETPVEATDLASAQTMLQRSTQDYARNLRAATPEQLNEQFDLGSMTVPLSAFATMLAVDVLHHHGQITYIQTLLGDTESHYDPDALGLLP